MQGIGQRIQMGLCPVAGKTVEDNGHRRLSGRNGRPVHLPPQLPDATVNANGFMEFREGSRACGQEQDDAQESIQKSHGWVFFAKIEKTRHYAMILCFVA
jgi:hypothetical protein